MWCRGCLVSIVGALIVGAVITWAGLANLGRFLDASEDIATASPADAILVMGGEGGRYTRTEHAIELYERGMAPVVVFSGGTLLGAGLACTSTELSVDAAASLGLPNDAIIVSGEAQSTYDEALNFAKLAAENNWQSLVLVTDRFHTRRSLRTLQTAMPEQKIVASSPQDPRFDADRWWSNEHGLVFAVNEALKLGYYWRTYGVRPF
jgi:uncharacterized SAM-binding protein YcdF (DUF218 family)